jgi:ubiquinone biosynthesis monooxygenase Coq7
MATDDALQRSVTGYPGRTTGGPALGGRLIKVNHAGEHGAVNIYRAQSLVCRLTAPGLVPQLRAFQGHEEGHRQRFGAYLEHAGVRRCRSYHFCGIGGYVLGFITALFGRSAVAATTVAVERVVLRHLEIQLSALDGVDPDAHAAVAAIIDEEREHHDSANLEQLQGRFWPRVLMPVVSGATELVIWLGLRL